MILELLYMEITILLSMNNTLLLYMYAFLYYYVYSVYISIYIYIFYFLKDFHGLPDRIPGRLFLGGGVRKKERFIYCTWYSTTYYSFQK